jgi:two-component system CheB/CheR fusion protein
VAHVRVRTGHDFSHYKRSTVLRRIVRRAQITRRDSLGDYYTFLRETPEEVPLLLSDLLISVTAFFRDPIAFDALARLVIPQLFANRDQATIRVWVAGCATGEEAYSIGMLLLEEAARQDFRPVIQIFGSDMDTSALSIAREGCYPVAIEADITDERLRRFFTREGDHYRVRSELRDLILFASHSLLKDPPFSRIDLVTCRNLLIYLDRELQHQVLHTFHYALNMTGFLFLGSSESADHPNGFFRTLDREARVYRSSGAANAKLHALPLLGTPAVIERNLPQAKAVSHVTSPNEALQHRQALEVEAPPSILVDETHRALHLSENAGRYLAPSGGPLTHDVTDLVRPELRFDLRAGLHRAFERDESSLSAPIPVRFNGDAHRVYLQVRAPRHNAADGSRQALVFFIEGDSVDPKALQSPTPLSDERPASETVRYLQQELQLTQAQLRATREESVAANEELRAANEELQSINEEYRSTSEELETSKEELQSINEELQTVNTELKLKLESISRAHSDLQNLMAAMDFGTLFLDPQLRIKRFTPRLSDLFSITPHDEGRLITDFTHQLEYGGLAEDARAVLKDLAVVEREIKSRVGNWYLMRIRPYRTLDDKIDGVVATFVDITDRRHAEQALRESEERLLHQMRLVELSRVPMFVWDFDDGIIEWNRGSEELYGYRKESVLGRKKEDLLKTLVVGSTTEEIREHLIATGSWNGEVKNTTKEGRELTVESQIELVVRGGRRLVLESTRDVSDAKAWDARQRLLLGELTHRVKNTLTVVQSLAHQTQRSSTSLDDFVERFDGRLSALANAHRLLVQSNWQGADLLALVRSQLHAYAAEDQRRVRIDGDAVTLPSQLATPFGLVLHELATNAAKYGALSAPRGYVLLNWHLDRNKPPKVHVTWRECDGPPVQAPERHGFGSDLISQGLSGATVRHEFLPQGVQCTIELPLLAEVNDHGANM